MKRLVMLMLLAALALSLPVAASTFIHMDQKALVRDSASVIQGRVISTSSYWNQTGQVIVTDALIQVEDTVLGNAPTVVIVRTFGGTVGGYTIEADGFPTFQTSERLLLFLEPENDGASRVAGYQQGQYRIVRDKSGVEIAVPVFAGASLVLRPDGSRAATAKALPLETLKASIRDEARRAGRPLEN